MAGRPPLLLLPVRANGREQHLQSQILPNLQHPVPPPKKPLLPAVCWTITLICRLPLFLAFPKSTWLSTTMILPLPLISPSQCIGSALGGLHVKPLPQPLPFMLHLLLLRLLMAGTTQRHHCQPMKL
jgi:hypothetical protein